MISELRSKLHQIFSRSPVISAVILTFVMFICFVILILIPAEADAPEVAVGMSLQSPIYSNISFQYNDHEASRKAGDAAEERVPHYYQLNGEERNAQLAALDELSNEIRSRIRSLEANRSYSIQESLDPDSVKSKVQRLSKEAAEVFRDVAVAQRLDTCFAAWKDIVRNGILPRNVETAGTEHLIANERILVCCDSEGWRRTVPVPATSFMRLQGMVERMTADVCRHLAFSADPDGKVQAEIHALFQGLMKSTLSYDERETGRRRAEARNKAQVYQEILSGQILIPKSSSLTADEVMLYKAYQEALNARSGLNLKVKYLPMIHKAAMVLAMVFFICIYIVHIHPEVARSNRSIWLMGGITIITLLAFRVVAGLFFQLTDALEIPQLLIFLVLPLAVPTLLISVIFGFRTAIFIGLFTGGIAALALGNSFPTVLTGLLVCGTAGFVVRYTTDYKKFFIRSFLACTLTTAFAAAVFAGDYLFRSEMDGALEAGKAMTELPVPVKTAEQADKAEDDGKILGIQVFKPGTKEMTPRFAYRARTILIGLGAVPLASGMITALLALLILFLLESLFGVVSNMSYLSFTDRNHKLLKELQLNAPGTYHHCERVALLAENAARAIGLDPVRVQACALFHDVGKLKYPGMFTENNAPGENMLTGMPPLESAGIIREHVTHGLELAKKYRLPKLLQDAISSHHGTDFISFFYEQAKQNGGTDGLQEKDYRYNGPLPEEKEVILVSLADCSEAAFQSIEKMTPETIREMVELVFERKQKAGQLNDSRLSLKEMYIVRNAFIDTLISMHKKRISYPGVKTGREAEQI